MIQKLIVKRDGTKQIFDKMKIVDAVLAAFEEVDGEITDYAEIKAGNIADYIAEKAEEKELGIEEIQDLVERGLMSTRRKDVARAYIVYRENRTRERNKNNALIKEVGEKLMAKNVQNQNANVDEFSFGGRRGEAADAVLKQYALDYLISPKHRRNHLENRIYIHDLNSYALGMHNCLSIPFDDLLAKGFTVKNGINVRPAGSVSTAFQLIAVIMQIQSLQQFGGVSSTHLDWTLVPYVRKTFFKHYKFYIEEIEEMELDYSFYDALPIDESDYKAYNEKAYKYALKMTEREVRQGAESLFHNLNTLQSRSGNQLPFSSINFGTCTATEGRMVSEALLLACIDGIGKFHTTSIFPCVIFQMKRGCNYPGDPNYDLFKLAQKSVSKRDYPNFANCDWSGNAGYDPDDPRTWFSTMGCRTANGWDINGFGQLKDGRGNIAPATIILPTIAMEAASYYDDKPCGDLEEDTINFFFQLLEEAIDDCKDELIERFEYICSQPPEAARFMYENNTMAGYVPEEGIRSALKHGTLAIGQLGLAECLEILISENQTTKKGMDLAKHIEQLFKNKCAEFKQTYKLNFGVYYTPAESLCYTAMKKFKARYGVIPKVSDREYFTNSIHVPVWQDVTCIEKINIESQLTGYSSAGCITYVELPGGIQNNLNALETIILYAMEHDIPYFAVNVPIDTCMDCGYTDELNDTCPQCGGHKIYRIRRVTGYLTGNYTETFNPGKQAEVRDRIKHYKGEEADDDV